MPIFDVRCMACYAEFEAVKHFGGWITPCPKCNNKRLETIYKKAPDHKLKGTGWHKTDYNKYGSNT